MFFEILERRQMLSVSFNSATGLLTIQEGNGRDRVNISQTGATLTVQEQSSKTQNFLNVKKIVIQDTANPNHAGKDSFVLSPSVTVPASITARGGGDVIVGGSGNDTILADGGLDYIDGGAGNDVILAGGVNNPLVADDDGKDHGNPHHPGSTILGGDGNDSIVGTVEDDAIDGGTGNDTIHGGDGSDTINGGIGDDYLFGDAGSDSVNGGDGNDSIGFGLAPDSIDGGAGNDLIQFHYPDPVSGVFANSLPATSTISISLMTSVPVTVVNNLTTPPFPDAPPVPNPNPPSPNTDPGPGASINGGDGNDNIYGGPKDDTINGGNDDDTICGGDGNDILNGEDGTNSVSGDAGDDTVTGGNGNNTLLGGDGNDVMINNGNANTPGTSDFVDGGTGINIAQEDFSDNIQNADIGDPTAFNDSEGGVPSFAQASTLAPVLSNSDLTVTGNSFPINSGQLFINDGGSTTGAMYIVSGGGSSDVVVTKNSAVIADFSAAQVTSVFIVAGSGADYMTAFQSSVPVTFNGGDGNDTLVGSNGNDVLNGQGDNDSIEGLAGDDVLTGEFGNDSLFGGPGTDYLNGGFGFNAGITPDGTDLLDGGDGNDYADYRFRQDNLTLRLDGTNRSGVSIEHDTIAANVENALGGAGNDTLVGNGLANYLSGGNGNDTIYGAGGGDALIGGNGADKVFGNDGYDFEYVSGDATGDNFSFGTTTAEFVQKDTTPVDTSVGNANPPA